MNRTVKTKFKSKINLKSLEPLRFHLLHQPLSKENVFKILDFSKKKKKIESQFAHWIVRS
jgi:hypothetical protein